MSITPRNRWKYPEWDADWQNWQDKFEDLVLGQDASVFSTIEGMKPVFKKLPQSQILENDGGVVLRILDDLVLISRTLNVALTIESGDTILMQNGFVCAVTTPGLVGPQETEFEILTDVPIDPDIQVFGYIDEDYNINWYNGSVLVKDEPPIRIFSFRGGSGSGEEYYAGTGLDLTVGNVFNHLNTIDAKSTRALYPISYDAQGHITGSNSAVTSLPNQYSLVLQADGGEVEGESKYTYYGSVAKTLNIVGGSNVSIAKASGQWTISSVNTTYSAGTGLSLSGTTFNHSNSVTAQATQALYPIKIDAQGHISAYGTAVTALPNANALTLKIKSGSTEGTSLYTYTGATAKTLDFIQGTNVTLTAGSGTLTIASTDTTYPLTQGHIAYGNGTGITGEADLFYDATSKRIGLRTVNPAFGLDINGISGFGGSLGMSGWASGGYPTMYIRSSRSGTVGSYSATLANQTIARILVQGSSGTEHIDAMQMSVVSDVASGDWDTSDNRSAHLRISLMSSGTLTERLRIRSTGVLYGANIILADANKAGYTNEGIPLSSSGQWASIVSLAGDNCTLFGAILAASSGPAYTASLGIIKSGLDFRHSNSVTAQATQALYPIKIDAQGHISAYGTAVTSLPTPNSLVLRADGLTSEGTEQYTFDGSSAKALNFVGGSNVSIAKASGQWTISSVNTTYSAGTGLSLSGTTFNHSNSVTAQGTQALRPIAIDGQGHISAYGSAVTSLPTPNSLILRVDGLTSEGTGQYTFDGSVAKELNIIGGTNVSIAKASGQWTISSTNTTYSAGTGLSLSGTTFNHSNSVTVQGTQALRPIAIDGQGHISAYGSAVTALRNPNNLILKIKTGSTEGTDLYTYDGSVGKTIDIREGSNVTLTGGVGTLTISATNTTYTSSLGISLVGTDFRHSNSTTVRGTRALYPISIDGQGHVTGSDSAVTSLPTPSSLILRVDGLSVEGTSQYTFDGSIAKTLNIIGGSNVSISKASGQWTFSSVNTTYSAGTGLSLSGTTFNHSNSVTAQGTQALYPLTYDAQGHITGAGSAVTTLPNANALTLQIKSGTTEGTSQYTYTGAAAKTLDFIQGSNVTLTAGSGTLTIASTDTTYSAGTGLSLAGTTFNHSNSVTAKSTQALYPIKIDAQGHISAYGTAVTALPNANALTLKIKSGAAEGTSLYTYTGATAKTLDFIQGTNVTLTAGSGTLTIASTDTTYPLTQGHIAYGNGTGITGEAALFYDATSKCVGLNTVSPEFGLDLNGISGFGGSLGLSGWASTNYPRMYIRSSRSGTVGSYSATLANQTIARIFIQGSSGTEHIDAMQMSVVSDVASGDWDTSDNRSAHLRISLMSSGTLTERLRIRSTGVLYGANIILADANKAGYTNEGIPLSSSGQWASIVSLAGDNCTLFGAILAASQTDTTYSAGTGLSLSGTTFNHSNSVTAQATQSLRPIAIDGQGHITSYGSAVTSLPTPSSLILRADGLTSEGTGQYTFDGSVAKTLNVVGGTNVSIAKASGQWTISSTDTTYPITNREIAYGTGTGITSNSSLSWDTSNYYIRLFRASNTAQADIRFFLENATGDRRIGSDRSMGRIRFYGAHDSSTHAVGISIDAITDGDWAVSETRSTKLRLYMRHQNVDSYVYTFKSNGSIYSSSLSFSDGNKAGYTNDSMPLSASGQWENIVSLAGDNCTLFGAILAASQKALIPATSVGFGGADNSLTGNALYFKYLTSFRHLRLGNSSPIFIDDVLDSFYVAGALEIKGVSYLRNNIHMLANVDVYDKLRIRTGSVLTFGSDDSATITLVSTGTGSVDGLKIGVPNTMGNYMLICRNDQLSTDWSKTSSTDPVLYIQSGLASANYYTALSCNTNGTSSIVAGQGGIEFRHRTQTSSNIANRDMSFGSNNSSSTNNGFNYMFGYNNSIDSASSYSNIVLGNGCSANSRMTIVRGKDIVGWWDGANHFGCRKIQDADSNGDTQAMDGLCLSQFHTANNSTKYLYVLGSSTTPFVVTPGHICWISMKVLSTTPGGSGSNYGNYALHNVELAISHTPGGTLTTHLISVERVSYSGLDIEFSSLYNSVSGNSVSLGFRRTFCSVGSTATSYHVAHVYSAKLTNGFIYSGPA